METSGVAPAHGGWWSQLNAPSVLLGAVLTTIFGVIGTLAYDRLTALDRSLEYQLALDRRYVETLPAGFAAWTLEVGNPGQLKVEDVRVAIDFGGGTVIEDGDVEAPPALELKTSRAPTRDDLLVEIPRLNGGDELEIGVLVEYPPAWNPGSSDDDKKTYGRPRPPRIDVRGDGVVGAPSEVPTRIPSLIAAMLGLVSALVVAAFVARRSRSERRQAKPEPRMTTKTSGR